MMYSTTNQKMWWGGTNPGTLNHYRDEANEGNETFVGQSSCFGIGHDDANGNITKDTPRFCA
jgi:hypothetical protein